MRMNESLAATYMIGGDPGLIIYKVDDSGVLSGLWSVRGHNGSGTGRLTHRSNVRAGAFCRWSGAVIAGLGPAIHVT